MACSSFVAAAGRTCDAASIAADATTQFSVTLNTVTPGRRDLVAHAAAAGAAPAQAPTPVSVSRYCGRAGSSSNLRRRPSHVDTNVMLLIELAVAQPAFSSSE